MAITSWMVHHFKPSFFDLLPFFPFFFEQVFGIMPIYLFNEKIFKALEETKSGINNEIQLTDAIQKLIQGGGIVKAVRVNDEKIWDVGIPEAYWETLNDSHEYIEKLIRN